MTPEDERSEHQKVDESPEETPEEPAPEEPPEDDEDVWPERNPSEDPRWALWIVWIWVGIALSSIVFILTLLVLGWYYD
jgi:hypothetical protein